MVPWSANKIVGTIILQISSSSGGNRFDIRYSVRAVGSTLFVLF